MEIDFLKVSQPSLHRKLTACGITRCFMILIVDNLELQEVLNITEDEVVKLKEIASNNLLPTPTLGNVPDTRLSTGCAQINSLLHGGLPTCRAIELFGCSGSGKTQFCLQLLLTVQLPFNLGGFNKSAVYICTEPPFPSKRFHELCQCASKRFHIHKEAFENNVFITICYNDDEFFECLDKKLPKLSQKTDVGLIVVDTIAALFRGDDKEVNYTERSLKFHQIIEKLRVLAIETDSVLLFVNQVTDNPETNETGPALGPSWSQLVAQRLQISRKDFLTSTRLFSVVNSYESGPSEAEFHITQEGLV